MQATTEIRQSESIANLAAALAKTQGELSFAQKNAVNPHLKNRYADLSSVWEACRVPLTKNGLAVAQFPGRIENGTMSLVTRLMH